MLVPADVLQEATEVAKVLSLTEIETEANQCLKVRRTALRWYFASLFVPILSLVFTAYRIEAVFRHLMAWVIITAISIYVPVQPLLLALRNTKRWQVLVVAHAIKQGRSVRRP